MALHRRGDHPARGARRRALVRGDHVNDAAAVLLRGDPLDLEPVDTEQERHPQLRALRGALTLRTLNQARDLTFVTMNCL
jgi:hypothetical protein